MENLKEPKNYYMTQVMNWGGVLLLTIFSNVLIAQNTNWSTANNIGIGTTVPGAKLQINGSRSITPLKLYYTFLGTGTQDVFTIQGGDDNGPYNSKLLSINSQGKFNYSYPGTTYYDFTIGGSLFVNQNTVFNGKLFIGNASASTILNSPNIIGQKLFVDGISSFTGRVTIGTRRATGNYSNYMLSVDGDIICKRQFVQISNWADFVFFADYKLRPLDEVQSYISQNGRLPDMPSQEEVCSQGLDLGEMLKLQQQKIEELTLYLIEQQKQIKELQSKIENHE